VPRRSSFALLGLLIVLLAGVIIDQLHEHRRAARPAPAVPRVIPPVAHLTAPARLNVIVRAPGGWAGDSIRAILERDFDYGDWLHVVPPESSAVAIVVQASVTMKGTRMTLIDGTTGHTLRTGNFTLPSIVLADSSVVADSLDRDLAAKDAVTRALLQHNARVADSLRRLQAERRTPSSFWLPPILRRGARAATTRDSLLRLLAHANADVRARAKRDTAEYTIARRSQWKKGMAQRERLFSQWRWALHGVADQLTQWMVGHRGMAQSRIAYIANRQLRVIDADGANDRLLASDGILMSPAWRHDGAEIVFSQLNDAGSNIGQLDLATGKITYLPDIPRGLNITPVYSPDDQFIMFARGTDRGTQLVVIPRGGGVPRPLVGGGADNAGPTFDLTGTRFAFSSARGGTPQIYSVNIDGTAERLETPVRSRGRSYRTSPDWSPDGRAIAFEQQNGDFQVWMVTLADHTLHRLTSVGENEDPSWAPDARHLVFSSTQGGVKTLWILDVPRNRFRQLPTAKGARLAAWSPAGIRRFDQP
jgi:tol-pal system beta propeller repeat protein TolB